MRTFIENYLHFMKNCIRPHYEKLNPLKSGFIENSNFENNRDPWQQVLKTTYFFLNQNWFISDTLSTYQVCISVPGFHLFHSKTWDSDEIRFLSRKISRKGEHEGEQSPLSASSSTSGFSLSQSINSGLYLFCLRASPCWSRVIGQG